METAVVTLLAIFCASTLLQIARRRRPRLPYPPGPPADPLYGIQQVLTGSLWDTEMCSECIVYKESQLRKARQTIWEALPVDFQLPSWEAETRESTQA